MGRGLPVALVMLGLVGCARDEVSPQEVQAPIRAHARHIALGERPLKGPVAAGIPGDLVLSNGLVMAVITAADHTAGFAASGGNLIDAGSVSRGIDQINQITLYLNDTFPRQAVYEKVAIIESGPEVAVVRSTGYDSADESIRVETDYILERGRNALVIRSAFVSTKTRIEKYVPGDAIHWGRTVRMQPGNSGYQGRQRAKEKFLLARGNSVSYAYLIDGLPAFETLHGELWSDPMGASVTLEVGKAAVFTRYLIIGDGRSGSLEPDLSRLDPRPYGAVRGQVKSGRHPGDRSTVELFAPSGDRVFITVPNDKGAFSLRVPVGRYTAIAKVPGHAPARADGDPLGFTVTADQETKLRFDAGRRSSIAWDVQSDGLPVKLTFLGIGTTPDPDFGPSFSARGAYNLILSRSGVGEAPISVGKYRVLIGRGPEYSLVNEIVDVQPGRRTVVKGAFKRVVDTTGFISADMHQHAAPSYDSGVSLRDRTLSNAAEGVEVLVSTEHNVITDYEASILALGLEDHLATIHGTEATTHSIGHFNAFPLRANPGRPRGGMTDPEGMSPTQLFELLRGLGTDQVPPFIQVNHPRGGRNGYFDIMKLDPETGRPGVSTYDGTFDGIEVVAFGWPDETAAVERDWYSLLLRGQHVTATGNSDTHTIFGREVGWPRTYVCVSRDRPSEFSVPEFIGALQRGCATVSAGPFVVIQSGDVQMGGLVHAKKGRFSIEVNVQAPEWVPTDRLEIIVDGEVRGQIELPNALTNRYRAPVLLECTSDCFVLAKVTSGRSLGDIVSGWRNRKRLPIALTNPIYVDVDGNGRFDPPKK